MGRHSTSFIHNHYFGDPGTLFAGIIALAVGIWMAFVLADEVEEALNDRTEILTYHNHSFIKVTENSEDTILFKYINPSNLEGRFLVNFQTTNQGFSLPTEQTRFLDKDKNYKKAICYTNQTNITITTSLHNATSFDNLSGNYVVNFTKDKLAYLEGLSSLGWVENPYQMYYNWSYETVEFRAEVI
jgi:hypothetical protein